LLLVVAKGAPVFKDHFLQRGGDGFLGVCLAVALAFSSLAVCFGVTRLAGEESLCKKTEREKERKKA
jgi:hypothetical protein